MKVICVDDVQLAVDYTVGQCRQLKGITEVNGFVRAMDALSWLDLVDIEADDATVKIFVEKIK